MIWFTADHHFGHANIIKYVNRPFSSVEEMDNTLINRWNDVVGPNDIVYHLGDFTLGTILDFELIVPNLYGKLKIVPGGHDHRWLNGFDPNDPYMITFHGHPVEILPPLHSLEFPSSGKYPNVIVLCHYPMLSWDRSHYGSTHLHGHTHGTIPDSVSDDIKIPPGQTKGDRMDIGVDRHKFKPVNLEEVVGEIWNRS